MAIRIDTPLLTAELKRTNQLLAAINETLGKIVEGGGGDEDQVQARVESMTAQLKHNTDALEVFVASVPST